MYLKSTWMLNFSSLNIVLVYLNAYIIIQWNEIANESESDSCMAIFGAFHFILKFKMANMKISIPYLAWLDKRAAFRFPVIFDILVE